MADSNEVWKPVVGFEGYYEVSDHGRVRSVDRVVTREWGGRTDVVRRRGRMMTPTIAHRETDHLKIGLRRGGRRRRFYVHRLVLEAFVGPAPADKPCGLHWDDDPTNNHLSNLRWGSVSDNMTDRVRNGGDVNASKTHCLHGHEYTERNTYRRPGGGRHCQTCKAEARRAWKARQKALQARAQQKPNTTGEAAA